MDTQTVRALIQISTAAIATLAEYLRQPPATDTERQARYEATMALMRQMKDIGDALLVEQERQTPQS